MIKNNLGNISGFTALILWSFYALFASFSKDIPTFFLMGVLSAILFSSFLIKWIIKKENIINKLKLRPRKFLIVFLGISIANMLYYSAFKLAPAFIVNILCYLWPMLMVIFLSVMEKKKLHFIEIIGIAFGFLGVVVLGIDLFDPNTINISYLLGYLLAILFALATAFYCASLKRVDVATEDFVVVFLYSSVIYFVLHFLYEEPFVFNNSRQYIVIIALTLCGYGSFFWNYALHNEANVKILASFSYFMPIVSSLLLWFFLKVNLTSYIFISAFFVIVGAILCNFKHIKKREGYGRFQVLHHIMHPHIHMGFKKKLAIDIC